MISSGDTEDTAQSGIIDMIALMWMRYESAEFQQRPLNRASYYCDEKTQPSLHLQTVSNASRA